jgi:phosphoribosylformylglycinamidine synthase PurS subunit
MKRSTDGSGISKRKRGRSLSTTLQRWIVEVEVMPKRGVNDPQGDAVLSGLRQLGFAEATRVRVGRLIRLDITAPSEDEARSTGRRMCERLLANPVIEEYQLAVHPNDQK